MNRLKVKPYKNRLYKRKKVLKEVVKFKECDIVNTYYERTNKWKHQYFCIKWNISIPYNHQVITNYE
jgi:hypothetical protein